MQKCEYCGRFLLTSYNQHLAIAHPKEWNKIKEQWTMLRAEGWSVQKIADEFNTNITTVNQAVSKKFSVFQEMRKKRELEVVEQ